MTRETDTATYVYALLAARTRPAVPQRLRRLAGGAAPRLIEVPRTGGTASLSRGLRLWLVVASVPLDRFGADAINARLGDLEWVSRAALAHEAVVEAFIRVPAVLPMKLFTIFASDERAVEHLAGRQKQTDAALARVMNHDEWGVRVLLAPGALRAAGRSTTTRSASGTSYLERKKSQREAAAKLTGRAPRLVDDLYDGLSRQATAASRRAPRELKAGNGRLLLDATALVSRSRTAAFRKWVRQESQRLAGEGYTVSMSGPWPPYSFVSR